MPAGPGHYAVKIGRLSVQSHKAMPLHEWLGESPAPAPEGRQIVVANQDAIKIIYVPHGWLTVPQARQLTTELLAASRRLDALAKERRTGGHIRRCGTPTAPDRIRPPRGATAEQRFWAYVDKGATGACWEWRGYRSPLGYGQLTVPSPSQRKGYTSVGAHRFSFELHAGPIPPGHHVCHRCNNKPCVNPSHLYAGLPVENSADTLRAGNHGRPRLLDPEGEVIAVEAYRTGKISQAEIARQLGVSRACVRRVIEVRRAR